MFFSRACAWVGLLVLEKTRQNQQVCFGSMLSSAVRRLPSAAPELETHPELTKDVIQVHVTAEGGKNEQARAGIHLESVCQSVSKV